MKTRFNRFGFRNNAAKLAILVGLAVPLVTGALASPASAYTSSTSGYAGSVGVPVNDGAYANSAPSIRVNARNITESRAYANYAQYVCITSKLWAIVPTPNNQGRPYWAQVDSDRRCGWINAAQTSIYDGGNVFPSSDILPGKGYSVTVGVTWQLSNGSQIGSTGIGYSNVGDYRCLTANCSVDNTNWGGGAYISFPNY
ncbi:MAG TPA: hypothetical protein VMZ22_02260 [Acidimicrobiales bacterium]|nr:hypothetical protein [Acidimicrobiales bacterium]